MSISNTISALLKYYSLTEGQNKIQQGKPNFHRFLGGKGQGGGRPGEKGAGGIREAGEEGAGSGIPKVAGSGRKKEELRNIAQYFAIEKMQRGGSQKIQGGNRD